jgi:hypothetical protein
MTGFPADQGEDDGGQGIVEQPGGLRSAAKFL